MDLKAHAYTTALAKCGFESSSEIRVAQAGYRHKSAADGASVCLAMILVWHEGPAIHNKVAFRPCTQAVHKPCCA